MSPGKRSTISTVGRLFLKRTYTNMCFSLKWDIIEIVKLMLFATLCAIKKWNMHIRYSHIQKTQPTHTAKKKRKRERNRAWLINDQFQNWHHEQLAKMRTQGVTVLKRSVAKHRGFKPGSRVNQPHTCPYRDIEHDELFGKHSEKIKRVLLIFPLAIIHRIPISNVVFSYNSSY